MRMFPQGDSNDEDDVRFWEETSKGAGSLQTFFYVDDTLLFDAVPLSKAIRHIKTGKTLEEFLDLELTKDFEDLSIRADDIGMKINQKKTQLLVISGTFVDSIDELWLVGFTFGRAPNAGAHVRAIRLKFRAKIWMLYNLRKGFKKEQLYWLYCCYLRTVIEYCSAVYHALLNRGQEEILERLHRHALRVCYGFDSDVRENMELNSIETLRSRRIQRCDAFIRKAFNNPRFGPHWFKARLTYGMALRRRRWIQEPRADSLRKFRSPLAFMARRANKLGLERETRDA